MKWTSLIPNLMCDDVDATVAWYQQHFAAQLFDQVPFEHAPDRHQWAIIGIGETSLMWQATESLRADVPFMADRVPGGGFTLFIRVEGLVKWTGQFAEPERIVKPLHTTFYGMQELYLRDPNGYILALAEPVSPA